MRSIPACAGEPRIERASGRRCEVYPRVCGGTAPTQLIVANLTGLSPRVRGNPAQSPPHSAQRRSIPACAGEPQPHNAPPALPWVYPRVCGGTCLARFAAVYQSGLSPRVRGNHILFIWHGIIMGSIPACAGEPRREADDRRPVAVYPRVCGGTSLMSDQVEALTGLSPRVRGNQ